MMLWVLYCSKGYWNLSPNVLARDTFDELNNVVLENNFISQASIRPVFPWQNGGFLIPGNAKHTRLQTITQEPLQLLNAQQFSVVTLSSPGRHNRAAHMIVRPVVQRSQRFVGYINRLLQRRLLDSLLTFVMRGKRQFCSACACNSETQSDQSGQVLFNSWRLPRLKLMFHCDRQSVRCLIQPQEILAQHTLRTFVDVSFTQQIWWQNVLKVLFIFRPVYDLLELIYSYVLIFYIWL